MDQEKFRSYMRKAGKGEYIDYVKALGRHRVNEIRKIVKSEIKKRTYVRTLKEDGKNTYNNND